MNITIELTPEQAAIVSAALRQRAKSILDARDSHLIEHEEAIKMHNPTWETYCLVSSAIDDAAKIGGGE